MNNPFYAGQHFGRASYHQSAEDRIQQVRTFNLEQCEQALRVEGLQKSVIKAIDRRRRQLETIEQPVPDIMRGEPLLECCRCRHKHYYQQRGSSPADNNGSTHSICPRCKAHTFNRAEEQPDIFAGVAGE